MSNRKRFLLVVGCIGTVLAGYTKFNPVAAASKSRLMTIESLVERGTLAADASSYVNQTVDKIWWHRDYKSNPQSSTSKHWYSHKPPLLALLGAVVYWPLWQCGITLAEHEQLVVWLLTWVLMGLPVALAAATFDWVLGQWRMKDPDRCLLTAVAVFGTLVFSYAIFLNNAALGAALVMMAFVLVRQSVDKGEPSSGTALFAGLLAGLAATIDIPVGGLFAALECGWLVCLRRHRTAIWFAVGGLLPALIHGIAQYQVLGTPLPAETVRAAFEYEGSAWTGATRTGIDGLRQPRLTYVTGLLIGPMGLLTLTPILAAGVLRLLWLIGVPERRGEAAVVLAGTAGVVSFYAFGHTWTNYGGYYFGVRWFVPLMLVLMLYAAEVWRLLRPESVDLPLEEGGSVFWPRRLARYMFAVVCAAGVVFAGAAVRAPWTFITDVQHPAVRALVKVHPIKFEFTRTTQE